LQWFIENIQEMNAYTYGSILNRMAEAVSESETLFEYIKKATNILYHTSVAKLFILCLLLYHLTELSIGNAVFHFYFTNSFLKAKI
jgi:hypothetical protein